MRLHRGVRMLAAVATISATLAPAAQAKFDNSTYPTVGAPYVVHHTGGSADWTLIGLGAAGGLALIGAGAATSRRALRRTAQTPTVSGS